MAEPTGWITIKGQHIPLFDGETKMDAIQRFKEQHRNQQIKKQQEKVKETNIEDAIQTVRDNIRPSALSGWFRNADSEFKPEIEDAIINKDGVLNAGLNIAYNNYRYQFERYSEIYGKWVAHEGVDQSRKLSFKEWLYTPQKMYRGDRGQKTLESDKFHSYTPDRKMALKFGDNITEIDVRPIDTWGSYQTTPEQEFLVPETFFRRK